MLEKFFPKAWVYLLACNFWMLMAMQEMTIKANKPAAHGKKDAPGGTGAWPAQVGVQRVAWNSGNGLRAAPLLASSTGSGLCRVDWLLGRWNKDKIPYYSVEGIRGEVAVDARDDDDED